MAQEELYALQDIRQFPVLLRIVKIALQVDKRISAPIAVAMFLAIYRRRDTLASIADEKYLRGWRARDEMPRRRQNYQPVRRI